MYENKEITFYSNSFDQLKALLKAKQRGITIEDATSPKGVLTWKDADGDFTVGAVQKRFKNGSWERFNNEFGNIDALQVKTTGLWDNRMSSALPISQTGDTALTGSFNASSLIGALNELKTTATGLWATNDTTFTPLGNETKLNLGGNTGNVNLLSHFGYDSISGGNVGGDPHYYLAPDGLTFNDGTNHGYFGYNNSLTLGNTVNDGHIAFDTINKVWLATDVNGTYELFQPSASDIIIDSSGSAEAVIPKELATTTGASANGEAYQIVGVGLANDKVMIKGLATLKVRNRTGTTITTVQPGAFIYRDITTYSYGQIKTNAPAGALEDSPNEPYIGQVYASTSVGSVPAGGSFEVVVLVDVQKHVDVGGSLWATDGTTFTPIGNETVIHLGVNTGNTDLSSVLNYGAVYGGDAGTIANKHYYLGRDGLSCYDLNSIVDIGRSVANTIEMGDTTTGKLAFDPTGNKWTATDGNGTYELFQGSSNQETFPFALASDQCNITVGEVYSTAFYPTQNITVNTLQLFIPVSSYGLVKVGIYQGDNLTNATLTIDFGTSAAPTAPGVYWYTLPVSITLSKVSKYWISFAPQVGSNIWFGCRDANQNSLVADIQTIQSPYDLPATKAPSGVSTGSFYGRLI